MWGCFYTCPFKNMTSVPVVSARYLLHSPKRFFGEKMKKSSTLMFVLGLAALLAAACSGNVPSAAGTSGSDELGVVYRSPT